MSSPGPSATPASTRAPRPDPLVGHVLDRRYRIGERVARGGMATVYRALDLRLDREVAVKVMHHGLAEEPGADDALASRLAAEARAAARLTHPNVVAVYDQGHEPGPDRGHGTDGVVWLAMELVEGRTLRDVVDEQAPLSPARALALLEPVVAALAAAHSAGLVHRDIKPENVLLADDGRVKVADFGLARAVSSVTGPSRPGHRGSTGGQHTTRGVLVGTVSYLAPELVTEGRADARADVYAVGVVLHELLTGVKPHTGESPIQVAYRHVHHDVPAPSARVAGIPAYVDALVARATARDPGLRPADAGVLLRQLRRVAHALADGVREDPELVEDLALPHRPADDRPAHPPGRARPGAVGSEPTRVVPVGELVPDPGRARPPRRRRLGLLVAVLVLALAVGGGAFWLGWARWTSAPQLVGLGEQAAERELDTAGLDVAYADPVHDADVRTGSVVSASPGAGERVLADGTVTLTLSLGPLLVPRVRDLDEDAAQDALLARGLDVDPSIERFSESRPAGTVLGSRPSAGTELRTGDPVALLVSKGRRPIPVGDWVGLDADRAESDLADRGLQVETTEVYSDDVAAGLVVTQDPFGGTLNRGDVVTLEVSQGPDLVEVPGGLAVRTVGSAQDVLEQAGFEVAVEETPQYLGLGIVARTDPPSGSMAPRGSTITLFVV